VGTGWVFEKINFTVERSSNAGKRPRRRRDPNGARDGAADHCAVSTALPRRVGSCAHNFPGAGSA
jgi:hypothetical protein